NGTTCTILIEDFEDKNSSWWSSTNATVILDMDFKYAAVRATFGIIACESAKFFQTIERFVKAANILPSYPRGTRNNTCAAARENYLFSTSFKESQFDVAVAVAKRGGFKRILLGKESWCQSPGH